MDLSLVLVPAQFERQKGVRVVGVTVRVQLHLIPLE